ncbi:MAG TPA: hypothetical protein VMP68_02880 [Candidatus Eisenbacteria bacterium]|nr:hypothetical protein [Candidatus Eisenbacteria bacterium]
MNALKLQWKLSVGGETTCGTFSNATVTFCAVYRNGWINPSTIGGYAATSTPSGTTGASGALSYVGFTLQNPFSSSWVVCAGGSTSGTVDSAPTGMTLRSGTSVTNYAFSDTNGNVSSWTTTSGPSPGVKWATACGEIVGPPSTVASSQSSKVSDYYPGQAIEACTGSCTWTFNVSGASATGSLSTNLLIARWIWGYTTTQPTISNVYCNSDSGHATWTWTQAGSVVHDATNKTDGYTYYVSNAASGCSTVTVVASSVWNNATGAAVEYKGFKTLDQYVTNIGGAPTMSNAALTPTASGDLIDWFCSADTLSAGGTASTGIFVGKGVLPYVADFGFATISGSFIYNSTSAITTATYARGYASGNNSICMEAAFKNDGTGTSPSGVSIEGFGILDSQVNIATTNLQLSYEAGDTLWIGVTGVFTANATQFTAASGQIASFTLHRPADANGGYPNVALDCNLASAGLDYVTLTSTSNASMFYYYKIRGLNNSSHSACDDTTAGYPTAVITGPTSSPSPLPTITPSTADGIVIALSETGTGPATATTAPTGAVYSVPIYTGQSDSGRMGTGNLVGHYFNLSTATQNWAWTNSVATDFIGAAEHLKAAPAGVGVTPPLWVIQP